MRWQNLLASKKCWCRQNTGVYKILALTKCWRRQNTGVDKILASTKSWRGQNVGADAEESPYCLARQSPQLLTSPKPRWRSPTSPGWCRSLCMQSPSVVLPLAALLLWADSLPYCTDLLYRPPCWKRHKFWRRQNTVVRLKFTDFCQTIAVLITAHRRPTKMWWNTKWSPSLSNISFYTHGLEIRGCPRDPPLWPLTVEMGCGWQGGGALLYLLPPVWQVGETDCCRLCAQDNTPPLSYNCLFLFLHLPLCLAASWTGVNEKIRTICAEQV